MFTISIISLTRKHGFVCWYWLIITDDCLLVFRAGIVDAQKTIKSLCASAALCEIKLTDIKSFPAASLAFANVQKNDSMF